MNKPKHLRVVSKEIHIEQVVENDVQKNMPRGYAKTVERMRKLQQDKMKDKDEEHKKAVGDRYSKERLKLDQAKSPSFLTNPI